MLSSPNTHKQIRVGLQVFTLSKIGRIKIGRTKDVTGESSPMVMLYVGLKNTAKNYEIREKEIKRDRKKKFNFYKI